MVSPPAPTSTPSAALQEVVGGPDGAHLRSGSGWAGWWTPVRVLLALVTVVFMLSVVRQYPCVSSDWSSNDIRYSKMCYSDVPYLYTGRGLAEHTWPYSDTHGRYQVMEYPVGISYFAWGTAQVTRLFATGPNDSERAASPPGSLWGMPGMTQEVNRYFFITAIGLFIFLLGTTWLLATAIPGKPWVALPFVLSPALFLNSLVNWDLLALLFVVGAIWAWHRCATTGAVARWSLVAGTMVGLGTAVKLYPLFILGAFLGVAIRRREWARFGYSVAAAVGSWVLANLPAYLSGPEQWRVFWEFNSKRAADLGSIWFVLQDRGHPNPVETINQVSWIFFGAACVLVLVLGLRAKRVPRVDQLAFLIVAAFLLINKVYSPQYVLWLLPLAVLARRNWRDLLIWQAGEVFYFAMVWFYLGGWIAPAGGMGTPAYQVAIMVRIAAELYLMTRVVLEILSSDDTLDADPVLSSVENDA
ncbi:MAG TPA: glycosyltransferase 87 family protein, partial [Marmoricola sp.]|nr:glycosyltransferase 87 family protein [Marmoricola sp.]